MKTSEILIKARDLIADPKRWTRGVWATDRNGESCMPEMDGACAWCAVGALRRASDGPQFFCALEALRDELGDRDPIKFSDTHTHAEVMTMFDTAIATAQARGD